MLIFLFQNAFFEKIILTKIYLNENFQLFAIKPNYYVHVLDNNSNVTRVESGPQTFTRQDHEKLVSGPDPMIMIPPRNYCIIANPVQRDAKRKCNH